MIAEDVPLDLLVDTTAVVGEVREDCEDGLHGPILHQLQLDRPDIGFAGHAVWLVPKGLVVAVALGVARLAGPLAVGRAAALLARDPGAVDEARLYLVGLAAVMRAVEAAGDEALLVPVKPAFTRIATPAACTAVQAAGQ